MREREKEDVCDTGGGVGYVGVLIERLARQTVIRGLA